MAIITGNKVPIYSQIAQTIKQYRGLQAWGFASVRTIAAGGVRAVHQAVHTWKNGIVQTIRQGMIVVKEGDSALPLFSGLFILTSEDEFSSAMFWNMWMRLLPNGRILWWSDPPGMIRSWSGRSPNT